MLQLWTVRQTYIMSMATSIFRMTYLYLGKLSNYESCPLRKIHNSFSQAHLQQGYKYITHKYIQLRVSYRRGKQEKADDAQISFSDNDDIKASSFGNSKVSVVSSQASVVSPDDSTTIFSGTVP